MFLVPYCVSIFDGKKAYSFYITDYNSSDEMLKASIQFILKIKYNQHRVYLHNFSYFDGIFLIKIISNSIDSSYIKPIIRDGRIINLRVDFGSAKNKYYIEFRYSYLLLPTSLEKLGKTLASNNGKFETKLPFPYNFVNNPDIGYDYVGNIPDYIYYDTITKAEYDNLKSKFLKFWDLKKETISYCEQDCRTLYYAIKEFSKIIYMQFGVDISKTPTISSLAFRIFRVDYLTKNNNIAVIQKVVYDFIYQSYFGGAVDAYIPYGENIKGYDVNALYPTSMFHNPVPVGNPYYFEGDINYFTQVNFKYPEACKKDLYEYIIENFNLYEFSEFEKSILMFLNADNKNGVLCNKDNLPFGFFEVDLETPGKELWNEPLLLKKHKVGEGGIRTIASVGQWKGVYYSEELYNAIKKN